MERKVKFSFLLLFLSFCSFVNNTFASDFSQLEKGIIEQVNQTRADENLNQLAENELLSEAARLKAQDMLARNYFAHKTPEGQKPWIWVNKVGYDYRFAGENLAMDFSTARGVHSAWMKSPKHKENIVSGDYTEIGVAVDEGVIDGKKRKVAVQFFGQPTEFSFERNGNNIEIVNEADNKVEVEIKNISTQYWPSESGGEVLFYADVVGAPDSVDVKIADKDFSLEQLREGKYLLLVEAKEIDWNNQGEVELIAKKDSEKVASRKLNEDDHKSLAENLQKAQTSLAMASVQGARIQNGNSKNITVQNILLAGLLMGYLLMIYNIKVAEKEEEKVIDNLNIPLH